MLRAAILAVSPSLLASLHTSFLVSCVIAGMGTIKPSLDSLGTKPSGELAMAFSTLGLVLGSNSVTESVCAFGAVIVPKCESGVGSPYTSTIM